MHLYVASVHRMHARHIVMPAASRAAERYERDRPRRSTMAAPREEQRDRIFDAEVDTEALLPFSVTSVPLGGEVFVFVLARTAHDLVANDRLAGR